MDRLDALLKHSSPRGELFYAQQLCHTAQLDAASNRGHLHVLYSGHLAIRIQNRPVLEIHEPSVVLFPRPLTCELSPQPSGAAAVQIVCAHVDFGQAMTNVLRHSIPDLLVIPLAHSVSFRPLLTLLFDEANNQHCGRSAALNHLVNLFLVQLLRHLMDGGVLETGILAALADQRLATALTAMHERPQSDWTLEGLAHMAGMSRARFAHHFRTTTGVTALAYLASLRIAVAKSMLQRGSALKMIAPKVGYLNADTLIRSFVRHTGQTPKKWLQNHTQD